MMIEQTEHKTSALEIIAWIVVNLLAMFLIAILCISLYIDQSSFLHYAVLGAGGLLIATFQYIFLRLRHFRVPGGFWGWMLAGLIASIAGLLVILFALVMFAFLSYSTSLAEIAPNSSFLLILIIICVPKFFLSITQSLLFKIANYKRVFRWSIPQFIGYASIPFIFWNSSGSAIYVFSTILIVALEIVCAASFFKILDKRTVEKVDNLAPSPSPYQQPFSVISDVESEKPKRKINLAWLLATILAIMAVSLCLFFSFTPLQTLLPTEQPSIGSISIPYTFGTPAPLKISLGNSPATISCSILSSIRGDEAWSMLSSADNFNDPPEVDKEYLLVNVAINYLSGPDGLFLELESTGFKIYSMYNSWDASSLVLPEDMPELRVKLMPGESGGGWLVYQVYKSDLKPLLFFRETSNKPIYFEVTK